MSKQITLTRLWKCGNETLSFSEVQTVEGDEDRDLTIADAVTNQEVRFVLDVSEAKSVYLVSTRTVTVKVNDSTSPVKTITLTANQPKIWSATDPAADNPFGTTDVTKLYITNSSGGVATITFRVGLDATV